MFWMKRREEVKMKKEYGDDRSFFLDRGCCTKAKNLGLERLGLAHRWLWAELQKRHTRVLRIWWKKLKHRYSSNDSFCVFILEELCQTSSSGVSSKVGFSTWESVKGWGHWFLSRNIFSKELSSYPGGTSAHRFSSTHIILVAGTCSAHGINPWTSVKVFILRVLLF